MSTFIVLFFCNISIGRLTARLGVLGCPHRVSGHLLTQRVRAVSLEAPVHFYSIVRALLLLAALAYQATAAPSFVRTWGTLGSGSGELNHPFDVAVDASGSVWVSDQYNHRLQKFTADGNWQLTAGSFGTDPGQLWSPHGLSTDAAGNVYVADNENVRVSVFRSDGVFLRAWGRLGTMPGEFEGPLDVAVGPKGLVYVSDYSDRIQAFQPDGTYLFEWGSFGSAPGQFSTPISLAFDPTGDVVVADVRNHRIQVFTSEGSYLNSWDTGEGLEPLKTSGGLAVDASGITVVDVDANRIHTFAPDGHVIEVWGALGTAPGQFNVPSGVAVGAAGDLYIAEWANHRIQQFARVIAVRPASWTTVKTRFR